MIHSDMRGDQPMGKFNCTIAVVLVVGVAMMTASGCGKKSVQSGGEAQSSQQGAAAKGGTSDSARSGVGSNFPDTSLQAGGGTGGGLAGLDKNPSEERLGGPLMAKADPSGSASRQLEDMRAEQVASAAAGLRDVFFGYDSWTITEEGRQTLVRDAEWLKANPTAGIKIEGHCDERGTTAYNLVLGEKRAKSVRNYLGTWNQRQ